ncbi:MAG: DUF3726 domain-containing protein [Hyphomicrobiales bacterium]|nr:DUF3726 domain-containing protein [Hyphomicrobiales bacterium]
MDYSLNEIELIAKRATRGAGYVWGMAEEAAKATRWLCSRDMDGGSELARLLQRELSQNPDKHVPINIEGDWKGAEVLCPLMVGASLSDCAARLKRAPIRTGRIASPAILLPFGANAARALECSISLECDGFKAVTDGIELSAPDEFPVEVDAVSVRIGGMLGDLRAHRTRSHPDPDGWEILEAFARKTYAPATEQSRLLGAGAGLSDND